MADLGIEKSFDSVRWYLIVKAVEAHTEAVWVISYVKRWLQALLRLPDGTLQRNSGTMEPPTGLSGLVRAREATRENPLKYRLPAAGSGERSPGRRNRRIPPHAHIDPKRFGFWVVGGV